MSMSGSSKAKKGGIKYISRVPVPMPLLHIYLLDGRLNVFKIYKYILSIRPYYVSNRLFLQVNHGRTKRKEFVKRKNFSKEYYDRSVKTICDETGVKGSILND